MARTKVSANKRREAIESRKREGRILRHRPATYQESTVAEAMLVRLREGGLKLTPQRIAIVRVFAADPTHPTAQELYERLRPTLPTMSFATVYNTLASLVDAGVCEPRVLTAGPARFDPVVEPHDHTVCDRCGRVADVPVEAQRAPANILDFEVRAVERIYRGRCGACALAEPRGN